MEDSNFNSPHDQWKKPQHNLGWWYEMLFGALFVMNAFGRNYNCMKIDRYHFQVFEYKHSDSTIKRFRDTVYWIDNGFTRVKMINERELFRK